MLPDGVNLHCKCISKESITLEDVIGRGNFSTVRKGKWMYSKKAKPLVVAVKIFKINPTKSPAETKKAFEELKKVDFLCSHHNIVTLFGYVDIGKKEAPYLVLEFMKDGDLLTYVRKHPLIKEERLISFCRDITDAMSFIHQNHFLHKDLAARNILVTDKVAKISDMGLTSFLNDDGEEYTLEGKIFAFRHAAKECVLEQVYTYETDVWAFGVLMWEVFTRGLVPYGSESNKNDIRKFLLQDKCPLDFSGFKFSSPVTKIMDSIFVDRDKRPSFDHLLDEFNLLMGVSKPKIEISYPSDKIRTPLKEDGPVIQLKNCKFYVDCSEDDNCTDLEEKQHLNLRHFAKKDMSIRTNDEIRRQSIHLPITAKTLVSRRSHENFSAQLPVFSSQEILKTSKGKKKMSSRGSFGSLLSLPFSDKMQRTSSDTNISSSTDEYGLILNRFTKHKT